MLGTSSSEAPGDKTIRRDRRPNYYRILDRLPTSMRPVIECPHLYTSWKRYWPNRSAAAVTGI